MMEASGIAVLDDDDIVALVWADGTFTTAAGTFVGGHREAKAAVLLVQAMDAVMGEEG